MKYNESIVRPLEKWQVARASRTVDLSLNCVGEWIVILNEAGFTVSIAADTFLDKAITKALAGAE